MESRQLKSEMMMFWEQTKCEYFPACFSCHVFRHAQGDRDFDNKLFDKEIEAAQNKLPDRMIESMKA